MAAGDFPDGREEGKRGAQEEAAPQAKAATEGVAFTCLDFATPPAITTAVTAVGKEIGGRGEGRRKVDANGCPQEEEWGGEES